MIILPVASHISQVKQSEIPKIVKINHLSVDASTYAPTSLTPDTLRQEPSCVIENGHQISHVFKLLTKHRNSRQPNSSYIRFIFRFNNSVTYVDNQGNVLCPQGTFKVDPYLLEKYLEKIGCPGWPRSEAVPPDWLPELKK